MTNRSFCSRQRSQPGTEPRRAMIKLTSYVSILSILLAAVFLATAPKSRAVDAPAWMHALTSMPLPKHDEKTEAVMLYSEQILIVEPDGKTREIDRAAYKILRPSGRHFGKVELYFDGETRITHIHGWCIPAQGKDFEVKDKDVTENGLLGMQGGELFSDHRVKIMEIPASDPGNIVGYEVEHEDRPYVLESEWEFQETVPVALARYTLQLPQGWEYKAVWLNHPEVTPSSAGGNQWSWELKDIPEITPEEAMPPWRGVAAMMLVSLIQPGGGHGFLTWSEMGAWQNSLLRGREEASSEIKQKVAQLTANAGTPLAKMLALADFMQKDIRYVGIWLGIGGWQPHAAPQVFANRYGDCKDKATLLSVMLKEVGIQSYYVVINSERGGVSPSIPPHLGLFDHVILAIRLPDDVSDARLMATILNPKLGKLLIFDPTDELTPFGSLNGILQASYALLVTPDGGELTQMPQLPPVTSGTFRTAKLTLDSRGVLRGEVQDERVGDSAWWLRGELHSLDKDSDRIKPVERLMSRSIGSFQITKAVITNLHDPMLPFTYQWSFVATDYGKFAGNLLLVRPRVLGVETAGLLETSEPRKYPVEFPGPRHDQDSFEIALPSGYEVDDLPPATDVEYPFGSYHSKTTAEGNVLRYTRSLEIKELNVPLDQVENLKKFYRLIAGDERNTAVLKPAAN
jgi:Domain of Unknown Function with PDB structure (DUF3857)/Transglutaminase-like superfamily